MKKFILGIFIGIIIALGAFALLKQNKKESVNPKQTGNALTQIRQKQNNRNDLQEKLQEAVLNLSNAKEPQDILKSLDEISKYRPNDPNVYALKAQVLQKQGNFPAAIEAINKAIALDPQNPNYYQMRAEMEFSAGDFKNAEKDFTVAAQLSGKADNYYNRAIANLNLGNYQAANNDFKKAQELYKKEGNLGGAIQSQNISKMLTKMPQQTVQSATPKTQKTNKATGKLQNKPVMDKKTMDKISKSLKHFSESETLKDFAEYMPKSEDIMSAFSGLSTEMPKTENPTPSQEKPVPTFEDMVKQESLKAPIKKKDLLKGTPMQSIMKARKMLVNKDFEGAKAELDSAIHNFPDNDELYYNRAQANYQNGDYKAAFADLNKALDLNPNNYQAALTKGDLFNSLGRNEQAKEAYLDAANIAQQTGNSKAAEDAQTRYQLLEGKEISARNNQRFAEASNAYSNGDYNTAVNLFNQIYQENPDGANAFNLALAYMGQGNMKKAQEMFAVAAEDKPKDMKVQMAAAQIAVQNKDFDKAQEYLDKAKGIDDTNPDLWLSYAQMSLYNEDYSGAKNNMNKALIGYREKLGEVSDEAERQRIEEQIAKINLALEQLNQAGI